MSDETRRQPALARRVVVCVDGSSFGERAVPHAIAVASALGAPLTLLRVLERPAAERAPADPLQWDLDRRDARVYVDRLAARLVSDGGEVEAELIEGKAADEICRWGASRQVDLTVATTHGESGPSPWALASTARKLLERAAGSLLIVPAATARLEGVARYKRILVPLDGSPEAEMALPIAVRIALTHGAELVIAHVVPGARLTQPAALDAEDLDLIERLRRRNERVGSLYLDRVRALISGEGLEPRVVLVQVGDVATRIAALTQSESVDLVVLAAHGQGSHPVLPCGGATAVLIARSTVPILVVRPRATRALQRVVAPPASTGRIPQLSAS